MNGEPLIIVIGILSWAALIYFLLTNKIAREVFGGLLEGISIIVILPLLAISFILGLKHTIDMDADLKDASKFKKLVLWGLSSWSIIGFFFVIPLLGVFGFFE